MMNMIVLNNVGNLKKSKPGAGARHRSADSRRGMSSKTLKLCTRKADRISIRVGAIGFRPFGRPQFWEAFSEFCRSVSLLLRSLSLSCSYNFREGFPELDRKSTRLNSSHGYISYAVFCLKKKKNK